MKKLNNIQLLLQEKEKIINQKIKKKLAIHHQLLLLKYILKYLGSLCKYI